MTDAGRALLRAENVHVTRGKRTVVHAVDLVLRAGEIVTLVGPNGAGKSTLLAALSGLRDPGGGRIERAGRVATALQEPALARRSVRANVDAGLAWWGVPRDERPARTSAALERLGVGHLAERAARMLSGGEARRVHLARALAVGADVLLLDEPFAGLDPAARADLLYDAASALRSDAQATLVVVHDRAEAWALADRVLVMIDGRIEAEGTPSSVFGRPPSKAVAAFVGFDGHLDEPDGVRMFRPSEVTIEAGAPHRATVSRRIPLEDGFRLELSLERGRLVATTDDPTIEHGDAVTVRLNGGVSFPDPAAITKDRSERSKSL